MKLFNKKRIASLVMCMALIGSTAAISASAAVTQPDLPNAAVRKVQLTELNTSKITAKATSSVVENYIYLTLKCDRYDNYGRKTTKSYANTAYNTKTYTASIEAGSGHSFDLNSADIHASFGGGSNVYPTSLPNITDLTQLLCDWSLLYILRK